MSKVQAAAAVPAPPEKVWELIARPATYDQWMTIHTKWKGDVPDRFRQGATADEVVTMLGMANTISWTVTAYEEASSLTISGTGMAGVKSTFTLSVESDSNGGATAAIDAEFEGTMVVGALGKAVEKDARANLEASLGKLAELVA